MTDPERPSTQAGADSSSGQRPQGSPPGADAVMIRSEEEVEVTTEWHPYKRMRIRKRVVTELRTVEVEVQREELVFEELSLPSLPGAAATQPRPAAIDFTLHEEHIVVDRTTVPVERITVTVEPVRTAVDVTTSLARERIVQENV